MSIILATTWYPRGELPRFNRLLPIPPGEVSRDCGFLIFQEMTQTSRREFASGKFSPHPRLIVL